MKYTSIQLSAIFWLTITGANAAPNDAYEMLELGALTGNNSGISYAKAISSDGSTVIGQADTSDGARRAFRWNAASGVIQDLGSLRSDNLGASEASAVSANGSFVVGYAYTDDGVSGNSRAFRWSSLSGAMQDLGSLRVDKLGSSDAAGISADGNAVVGSADTEDGLRRAFFWSATTGTMQDLGSLRADNRGRSNANAISADGTTVIGTAGTDWGGDRAFRWTTAGGNMQDLGTLRTANDGRSAATSVSANGNSVVGNSSTDLNETHAFYWSTATGTMQDLGTLRIDNRGSSSATAISANGEIVIGGASTDDSNNRAFRWNVLTSSMQDLGSLRTDNLGISYAQGVSSDGNTIVGSAETNDRGVLRAYRWTSELGEMQDLGSLRSDKLGSSVANGVSADGKTIVGYADNDDGISRAFIYRAMSAVDPGIIQDYASVLKSFSKLANETALAVNQQQSAMENLLTDTCVAGGQSLNCLRISGVVSNSQSTSTINTRNQSQGILTLGHAVSDTITIGGSFSSNRSRTQNSGVNSDIAYGLSLWGEYSENGSERTGWQAKVGVGKSTQNNDLARGKDLKNVQELSGSADMSTVAGRIQVGYGTLQKNNWLITPSASVSQLNTTRDAYSESDGAITGEYKKSRINSIILGIGSDLQTPINAKSRVTFGGGVEYDLKADTTQLNGTTDVPGLETLSYRSSLTRNKLRPYASANLSYDTNNSGTISVGMRVAEDTFSNTPRTSVSLSYGVRF